MSVHRQMRVPSHYYAELRRVQEQLLKEQKVRVPLWRCAQHVTLEHERWRDDEWFKW